MRTSIGGRTFVGMSTLKVAAERVSLWRVCAQMAALGVLTRQGSDRDQTQHAIAEDAGD